MAEKTYYFLKLPSGFFKDRPLKKLRRMAGGAVYTIIYQKLLLLSLENEGKLFFEEIEETFEEEMALELDETIEDIQMTLIYLQKNNLIQQVNQYEYFLPQIPEMISKETDAARRKRKSRENKLIVTESQKSVTSSQDVTKCHTELEVRSKKLDLEKELELDLEKEKETPPAPPDDKPKPTPYKKIEDLYHKLCPTFNKIQKMTNARKDTLKVWFRDSGIEEIITVFQKAGSNNFLKGNNKRKWKANFDWIINPTNRVKILEGYYDESTPEKTNESFLDIAKELYEEYRQEEENEQNGCIEIVDDD